MRFQTLSMRLAALLVLMSVLISACSSDVLATPTEVEIVLGPPEAETPEATSTPRPTATLRPTSTPTVAPTEGPTIEPSPVACTEADGIATPTPSPRTASWWPARPTSS